MKLVVFGATGGTGLQIVEQALAAGNSVTAFVRSPEKLRLEHPALVVAQGDVQAAPAVAQAIAGQDAVISALGPSRPPTPGMMASAAANIVAGMQTHGVRRLLFTTGAGVRDPLDRPKLSDRLVKTLLTLLAGEVLRDSEAGVNVIRAADLDWTIVRFPRLTGGPRTDRFRAGFLGKGSGMQISRADGAAFILQELAAGQYIRQAPVVSY